MSAPSHELAQHLADQGAGALGTDLFANQEPATPDNVMTVYDTGGQAPVLFDEELRAPTIMIRTRSYDYAEAYARQEAAWAVLNAVRGGTINQHRYIGVWLVSDIIAPGRDDNDRHILTANYQVERHPV